MTHTVPGNQPPAMVPRKAVYMLKDTARLSDYYQIPLNQISVSNA